MKCSENKHDKDKSNICSEAIEESHSSGSINININICSIKLK